MVTVMQLMGRAIPLAFVWEYLLHRSSAYLGISCDECVLDGMYTCPADTNAEEIALMKHH